MMRTTLSQIAVTSGTSVSTVSRVVNGAPGVHEDTRRKVLQVIDALDLRLDTPQTRLKLNRDSILTVFPRVTAGVQDNRYFTGVLAGITEAFTGSQWRQHWQLSTTHGELDWHTRELLESGNLAGLIMVSRSCTPANAELAAKHGVPVVVVNRHWPGFNCVYVDDTKAGYDTTKHLLHLGHKQIVYLGDTKSSSALQERVAGYRQAMLESCGTEGTIYELAGPERITCDVIAALKREQPGCTAIFCSYDSLAMALIQALKQNGVQVPRQISVAGFNNVEAAAYLDPPLTTVTVPLYDMGVLAAEMLQHLIQPRRVQKMEVCVQHELIIRQSTAPALQV